MKKTLLYKDKAGNKLFAEEKRNTKLAVRNKQGRLVNTEDTRQFIIKAFREKPSIRQMTAYQKTHRKNAR